MRRLSGASRDLPIRPARSSAFCVYSLGNRIRAKRDGEAGLEDPLAFLEHCASVGSGGVQISLGAKDDAYSAGLRARAEALGMFVEGISKLPSGKKDLERFGAEMRAAAGCGATVVRVVLIPGRRYEKYATLAEFEDAFRRGRESLELAEPVAAKHRVRLAVENHNDQRIEDRVALLRSLSSEWIGACVDPANGLSLLEDPVAVARAHAPWVACVHLKDLVIREHADGFAQTDVALGEGILDLQAIVSVLREARPEVRFSLETITKEPHVVPCLTEAYWSVVGRVPARELASVLSLVRAKAVRGDAPVRGAVPRRTGIPGGGHGAEEPRVRAADARPVIARRGTSCRPTPR